MESQQQAFGFTWEKFQKASGASRKAQLTMAFELEILTAQLKPPRQYPTFTANCVRLFVSDTFRQWFIPPPARLRFRHAVRRYRRRLQNINRRRSCCLAR